MRYVLLVVVVAGGVAIGLGGGWYLGQHESSSTAASSAALDPATALANGPAASAEGVSVLDALTLRGSRDLYKGYPAQNSDGSFNVVVEIPTGTNAKWEVTSDGTMTLEVRDGKPRVVQYLPYLGNYGMMPGTKLPKEQGGDGDALDVLILGPTLPRGTVARVRLIGVMKFLDKGEQDDKILAVMDDTPLSEIRTLKELNERYPEVTTIVHLWFMNYKGPGKMDFKGWGEADEAKELVQRGIAATNEVGAASQP